MLQLKNIVKKYAAGDTTVEALRDLSLDFRKSEFVAILGPSGCGKTTLLNIIGGLDRYTSGDLVINNVSTKEYKDVDWDIYRNNSIGFVFQSYNLIPHQTALANVELAMTLAGISKSERRERAKHALEQVGLADQINKKPSQMSGGQMQRVSIARALVNNPDILLADEPTGALDSETSVQIMEILKEVAKDRLVIMVTHNPDLADQYSNRIIRLLDGRVTDDTNPFLSEDSKQSRSKDRKKKVSMNFFTALALSMNNLMTKKTRTILTAFAGSIGIIGIALIMSLSSGMQDYIDTLQKDTLSSYPLQLKSQSMDIGGMMTAFMEANNRSGVDHDSEKVYSNDIMQKMLEVTSSTITNNDLSKFKDYIDNGNGKSIVDLTNSVKYGYDVNLGIYKEDDESENGILKVNPSPVMEMLSGGASSAENSMGSMGGMGGMGGFQSSGGMGGDVWTELIGNGDMLESQYDVIAGSWPKAYDEVILVLDANNEISDMHLYSLGLLDADKLNDMIATVMKGEAIESSTDMQKSFSYDELLAMTFKLVLDTDYYVKEENLWADKREDNVFMKDLVKNAPNIKVVGIVKPNEEATATSISGTVGYTAELTEYVVNQINDSEIAKEQLADSEINVFTGSEFIVEEEPKELTSEDLQVAISEMSPEEQAQFAAMTAEMSEEEVLAMMTAQLKNQPKDAHADDTYESNIKALGVVDFDNPSSMSLYPKDFASKEAIKDAIDTYNKIQQDEEHEEYVIHYTDLVGVMTSGMSSIIDIISYVLIAFVSISLVVSSIMIAIITYISVLERTKEIGILRSIGASKRDISRVFNAETIIEGLIAGILGVGITLLLNIPANAIIKSLTNVSNLSALPLVGAVGLIALSVLLTVLAGFIPSKMAAKKDPVVALRSE